MRKQIRDAIVTRLQGITGFADVVYPYRTAPHIVLPDIVVTIVEDEVNHDYDTKGGARMHELTVDIEIRDKATDYLDDTLDGICLAVEKAMMTDAKFGGMVYHLELAGTTIEIEEGQEKDVGLATITYTVLYWIDADDPETVIS